MDNTNYAPFYAGQRVIAVDACPGSAFKNGTEYICSGCEYKESGNPISPPGAKYWYIGIVGHHNGGCYFRPSIFASIPEAFQQVSFERVIEDHPVSAS